MSAGSSMNMLAYAISSVAAVLLLPAVALADGYSSKLAPICLNTIPAHVSVDGTAGCKRYTSGFDVTGTTNFVQFKVKNVCDCIMACYKARDTCANWVWKYVDNSGYRKCTLYSDFNMPAATTLGIKTSLSVNLGDIEATVVGKNFQQAGGLVPHCQFFDKQGKAYGFDRDCKSGGLFTLDNPSKDPGAPSNNHFVSC